MNKLCIVAFLVAVMTCATRAQEEIQPAKISESMGAELANNRWPAAVDAQTSAEAFPGAMRQPAFGKFHLPFTFARTSEDFKFDKPALFTTLAEPSPAAPEPRFVFGGRDDFRWQMGLGISLLRFRSRFYYATGVGTDMSLTYFTNDWFGFEGRVTTAFAPTIYVNEHVKYVGYGVGPKIAWREQKFEPFVHAIVGGAHVLPRTAGGSPNGFALQLGGGAGYRFNPRLSARFVVDWAPTRFFGERQDNVQAALEAVIHF